MRTDKRVLAARVLFQRTLSAEYRHLGLTVPGFAPAFQPGQFVMIRSPRGYDPLIGRAFSIYRIGMGADPIVEILYKIMGKGTASLAQLDADAPVDVLGPLGNGFAFVPDERTTVLVAGGIGVPPIVALASLLAARKSRPAHVFLGGKTSADILCAKEFEAMGVALHITTEDGSLGATGILTDVLDPFLRSDPPGPVGVYACGPAGMLAAVAGLTEPLDIPCQVSVEASMACGFGACMGCASPARGSGPDPKFKMVCQDGPVFDSRELAWKNS